MTKIYLAGKIGKNDWRHELVPGLRDEYDSSDIDRWANTWTPIPMYRADFHCVGPFFISCDHGCAHGPNSHGAAGGHAGCIVDFPYLDHGMGMRQRIMMQCNQAIKDCDVFFAWLGKGQFRRAPWIYEPAVTPDCLTEAQYTQWVMVNPGKYVRPPNPLSECGIDNPFTGYGTLIEIGIAAALGKTVVIGSDELEFDHDLWFAHEHADYLAVQHNPVLAFNEWAEWAHPIDEQRSKCESPLELAFWDAYKEIHPHELVGLVAQHKVSVGKNYRLDFAIPPRKIAFEMDGFTYHSDSEAFNRDRRRDLDLKLEGWQVHRFDGDLIRSDPQEVVRIAAKLAQ